MEHINWPDTIIAIVIILSFLIGLFRGLIKESLSLVTWVLAVVFAVMFSESFSSVFTFTKEPFIKMATAFFIIFLSTVIVGAFINYFIGVFVRKTPFSTPDRILGGGFGLLRGVVIMTVVVLLAGLTPATEKDWWQASYSVEKFETLAVWVKERLPEEHAKPFKFPDRKPETKSKNLIGFKD